ncbi:bacteriocin fulvocin C-related protein [Streptomyces sp. KM273126]|nr:bacteriocin fulvocin C-related protein [Streptomyces sp. KM273126]
MGIALAARLGPRRTLKALQALGRLREAVRRGEAPSTSPDRAVLLSRKNFLYLCGGAVSAAGLVLAGQTPAFARSEASHAREWVALNQNRLPHSYKDIGRLPVAHRKEVLRTFSPREQARLWVEHLHRYKAAHPDLTAVQAELVDEAAEFVPRYFAEKQELAPRLRALGERAQETLGEEEAHKLLGLLGPEEASETRGLTRAEATVSVGSSPGRRKTGTRILAVLAVPSGFGRRDGPLFCTISTWKPRVSPKHRASTSRSPKVSTPSPSTRTKAREARCTRTVSSHSPCPVLATSRGCQPRAG